MDVELKKLDAEILTLEEAASSAKVLRNKANYVTKELEMFDDVYLKTDNWIVFVFYIVLWNYSNLFVVMV